MKIKTTVKPYFFDLFLHELQGQKGSISKFKLRELINKYSKPIEIDIKQVIPSVLINVIQEYYKFCSSIDDEKLKLRIITIVCVNYFYVDLTEVAKILDIKRDNLYKNYYLRSVHLCSLYQNEQYELQRILLHLKSVGYDYEKYKINLISNPYYLPKKTKF